MMRQITTEEVCRKLKPVFGSRIDKLYMKYALSESREERDGD